MSDNRTWQYEPEAGSAVANICEYEGARCIRFVCEFIDPPSAEDAALMIAGKNEVAALRAELAELRARVRLAEMKTEDIRPTIDVCGFVGNEFTNKTTGKRWRFDGQSWIEMPPREAFDAAILRRQGERTMSKKDDGGPAFPFAGEAGHSLNDSGMTLRDYFAAKAMAALIAEPRWDDCQTPTVYKLGGTASSLATNYAKASYAMADAMLAAREAKQ